MYMPGTNPAILLHGHVLSLLRHVSISNWTHWRPHKAIFTHVDFAGCVFYSDHGCLLCEVVHVVRFRWCHNGGTLGDAILYDIIVFA